MSVYSQFILNKAQFSHCLSMTPEPRYRYISVTPVTPVTKYTKYTDK